jgi:ectoine hydroxylase-related dioxygenase (phytanoyl-CoA dioxygenase family)
LRSLWLKCFVYLSDVAADGGCTAVVEGSHAWGEFRQPSLDPGLWRHTAGRQTEMPGTFHAAVPAGSAFIFDTNCWHCALPNVSEQERSHGRCFHLDVPLINIIFYQ